MRCPARYDRPCVQAVTSLPGTELVPRPANGNAPPSSDWLFSKISSSICSTWLVLKLCMMVGAYLRSRRTRWPTPACPGIRRTSACLAPHIDGSCPLAPDSAEYPVRGGDQRRRHIRRLRRMRLIDRIIVAYHGHGRAERLSEDNRADEGIVVVCTRTRAESVIMPLSTVEQQYVCGESSHYRPVSHYNSRVVRHLLQHRNVRSRPWEQPFDVEAAAANSNSNSNSNRIGSTGCNRSKPPYMPKSVSHVLRGWPPTRAAPCHRGCGEHKRRALKIHGF